MPLFNVPYSVTIDYEVEVEGARVRVRRHERSDPREMDKTSSVKSSTTSPPNTQHTDRLHSDPSTVTVLPPEAASEDEVWQMIDGEHPDGTNILDLDASEVNVHVDGSSFNVEELD